MQTPHLILRDQLPPRQGCVQVHDGLGIQGVHQSQNVANLMSRHMDQIRQPDPCQERQDRQT